VGSNPATPTSYKPHFLGLVSSRGVRSACCIANGSANRDRGWPLRPSGRGVTGELQTGAREASRQCAQCEIRIRLDERVVVCQTGRAHQQVIWRPGEPTLPFLKRVQVGKVGYHGLSAGTIGNPRMSDALARLTDVAVDVAERDTVTRQVLSWLCAPAVGPVHHAGARPTTQARTDLAVRHGFLRLPACRPVASLRGR
jgi:hypothetical protein